MIHLHVAVIRERALGNLGNSNFPLFYFFFALLAASLVKFKDFNNRKIGKKDMR